MIKEKYLITNTQQNEVMANDRWLPTKGKIELNIIFKNVFFLYRIEISLESSFIFVELPRKKNQSVLAQIGATTLGTGELNAPTPGYHVPKTKLNYQRLAN